MGSMAKNPGPDDFDYFTLGVRRWDETQDEAILWPLVTNVCCLAHGDKYRDIYVCFQIVLTHAVLGRLFPQANSAQLLNRVVLVVGKIEEKLVDEQTLLLGSVWMLRGPDCQMSADYASSTMEYLHSEGVNSYFFPIHMSISGRNLALASQQKTCFFTFGDQNKTTYLCRVALERRRCVPIPEREFKDVACFAGHGCFDPLDSNVYFLPALNSGLLMLDLANKHLHYLFTFNKGLPISVAACPSGELLVGLYVPQRYPHIMPRHCISVVNRQGENIKCIYGSCFPFDPIQFFLPWDLHFHSKILTVTQPFWSNEDRARPYAFTCHFDPSSLGHTPATGSVDLISKAKARLPEAVGVITYGDA